MARSVERGIRDARRARADPEAVPSRSHVTGGVTARTVAVEAADRDVIAGRRDHGDVEEGRVHRRAVTAEAPGDALVRAGGGVEHVVARGRVALTVRRRGRNVLRGQGAGGLIFGKGRGGRVAADAVAAGRMLGIERGGGARV